MRLKGITLLETVITLLIMSIISLTASAAYSTAGNISMHAEDIREEADEMSGKIAEMYLDYDIIPDKSCRLRINDDIIIEGELIEAAAENSAFEGFCAVRPILKETVDDDDDEEETSED